MNHIKSVGVVNYMKPQVFMCVYSTMVGGDELLQELKFLPSWLQNHAFIGQQS